MAVGEGKYCTITVMKLYFHCWKEFLTSQKKKKKKEREDKNNEKKRKSIRNRVGKKNQKKKTNYTLTPISTSNTTLHGVKE